MTLTIAQIASKALGAARKAISDAVADATVTQSVQGAYNTTTGTYALTVVTQTGRAVFQGTAPIADMFPDYVVGPTDNLMMLEGFTGVKENDIVTVSGDAPRTVLRVIDIGGAGSLYNVIVR